MRHEKVQQVLEMARLMAGTAEGLTLDQLGERLGEERRTTERMRDCVKQVFPQMEVVEDPPTRRFRIPGGLDAVFQTPTAEELAALRRSIERFAAEKNTATAALLRSLESKLLSRCGRARAASWRPTSKRSVQAEALALHAGPRPFDDDTVLSHIREAILTERALAFDYHGGKTPGSRREVTPYGVLFGRANYLVATEQGSPEIRKWRLDRMGELAVLKRRAVRPSGFSLQAYADESFGIYRDEIEDVELLITPEGADDALGWRFHANQRVEQRADGSVRVRFQAAGMLELAWHLFTWGDRVRVVSPPSLRELMVEQLRLALAAHEDAALPPACREGQAAAQRAPGWVSPPATSSSDPG
jgi:predicted DNA-binding transcriptional regulator YafY